MIMSSTPITIQSTSSRASSNASMSELFNFAPSPPLYGERHACAYPSWPDRANLRCSPAPASSERSTDSNCYFSDLDLCAPKFETVRPNNRLRGKPANYLEIEFEDDSDEEENMPDSASNGTPEIGNKKVTSSSKSVLGDQIRREKSLKEQRLRFSTKR